MIGKLKNKIRDFEDRFRKLDKANSLSSDNQQNIKANQQLLLDYNHLSQLFHDGEFIPNTRWSLSPSTIVHILNDILLNEKKNIIEFGSGSSTLYIAKFLKNLQLEAKFFSIESDEKWIEKIKYLAGKYDILDYISIVHAPLVDLKDDYGYKNQTKWYDPEALSMVFKSNVFFDLVIVDGPVGFSSPYVRYSAIPILKFFLTDDVSVYLDDTFREEELEIIKKWEEILNLPLKHFNKYSLLTNEQAMNVEPFKINNWSAF